MKAVSIFGRAECRYAHEAFWATLCIVFLFAALFVRCSAEETSALSLRKPAGVAYDGKGRLIVSDTGNHRLLVFDGQKLVGEIGKKGDGPGEFNEPAGITMDSQGRLIVCDSGNGRIQVFNLNFECIALFGKPSSDTDKSAGTFSRPCGVATDDRDNIIVTDLGNSRLQIFDRDGKFLRLYDNAGKQSTDMEGFNEPSGVFYDLRGRLFVANGWNSRCDVYDYDSATQAIRHRGKVRGQIWGFWVCGDVALNSRGEVVALDKNNGAVCVFPADFEKDNQIPLRRFDGEVLGHLRGPQAVAISPRDEIAVCDTGNDRVLILNKDLRVPPRPEVLSMAPAGLTISWQTLSPARTILMLREGNSPGEGEGTENLWLKRENYAVVAENLPPSTSHTVTVRNLKPSTRYWYKVHIPELNQIPLGGFSQEYAAATFPQRGVKQFVRVPIVVVLFPNVVNLDTWKPDSSPLEAADKERLRYYVEECARASRFYWVNTRMNLFLDNSFVLDETWYYVGERSLDQYGIPENMKEQIKGRPPDWRTVLAEKKLNARDFCGAVVLTAQRSWDGHRKQWVYDESGGGTYGMRFPTNPGETSFLGGSDLAWLYTHEVGHQVDSFFGESGYEGTFCEWMSNHLAPMTRTAYKHGEHYDGNAWLARAVPTQRFFQLKCGEICKAEDNDSDGIPDNDKRVPLDEVRFRSNPAEKDTDYDGLPDMQEALVSNWIFEMLPAVSNARADYKIPDPTDPDTDDDGVPDGFDKYPLYAANDTLARAAQPPLIDGQIEREGWSEIYSFTAGEVRATIFGTWDEGSLYLAFRFNREIPRFYFQLDMDDDGWFVGKDNYEIAVSCSDGKCALADAWVHHCAERKKWPFRDEGLSREIGAQVVGGLREGVCEVEVRVPRRELLGLDLQPGEVIGLTFNCLLERDSDKWVSAFEPYRFFEINLVEGE